MIFTKIIFIVYAALMLFNLSSGEEVIPNNLPTVSSELVENRNIGFEKEEDVISWIGQPEEKLLASFGEQDRTDQSAYDYEWWVYTDHRNYVYQFGVSDGLVETVYIIEDDSNQHSYDQLHAKYSFQPEVSFEQGESNYTFRLTPEDMKRRPLAKISENTYIQFYFDAFTNDLLAYRVLTGDTLVLQRPYEVEYTGVLPEQPDLIDETWREVDKGMEQQIYDVTNVIRRQHEVPPVEWDQSAQSVAYLHSEDMGTYNYFSHTSLNGDGLKERLEAQEVMYMHAAENIASGYIDALSAMEGWVNSESHREALLDAKYTHLGVGVYRLYYTQNFLSLN